jgi:integrative and conjugative element protein (TIGR02256 family)
MTRPAAVQIAIGELDVTIDPEVLAVFHDHRQTRSRQNEAGGQLFAKVIGSQWQVKVATGPRSQDRRGRFRFWPDRESEQDEIYRYHSQGLDFVGDWHTHPQDIPQASASDLSSIASIVSSSRHHLPGFLMIIVGRRPFPEGLWASFHLRDGSMVRAQGSWREDNQRTSPPTSQRPIPTVNGARISEFRAYFRGCATQ